MATKKEETTERDECKEPCPNPTPTCPALNTTNAMAFIKDAMALPFDEREKIGNEIQREGIVQFVRNRFSVTPGQANAMSQTPPSALAVYTCEFAEGIKNHWDNLDVKISDRFASGAGGGTSFRCKNEGVEVSVSSTGEVTLSKSWSWG